MSRQAEAVYEELKTLAERVGLRLREEVLLREVGYHPRSGSCRVRGEEMVFIDRSLPVGERIAVLADELRRRNLQGIYVAPALRRFLGDVPGEADLDDGAAASRAGAET